MSNIRIITDSSAQFINEQVNSRYQITTLPMRIQFGSQTFIEGIELDAEHFFQRLLTEGMPPPAIIAPSTAEFQAAYARLSQQADQILVLLSAHGLSETVQNAQEAAEAFVGRCEIIVLDSLTTSVGLGMLVHTAAQAAQQTGSLEQVVRVVRGAVPRVYSIFYVETLDYLYRNNLLGESQAILGKMLGIKPFLTIEDGELITMEKVRTRAQALDKLIEFVAEFSYLENLVILQNTSHFTEQTRQLQERLALEFDAGDFPVMMYGPTLGTHLGPDSVGIVVYEAEEEEQIDTNYQSDHRRRV